MVPAPVLTESSVLKEILTYLTEWLLVNWIVVLFCGDLILWYCDWDRLKWGSAAIPVRFGIAGAVLTVPILLTVLAIDSPVLRAVISCVIDSIHASPLVFWTKLCDDVIGCFTDWNAANVGSVWLFTILVLVASPHGFASRIGSTGFRTNAWFGSTLK